MVTNHSFNPEIAIEEDQTCTLRCWSFASRKNVEFRGLSPEEAVQRKEFALEMWRSGKLCGAEQLRASVTEALLLGFPA